MKKPKRFLLFDSPRFYPSGGWGDLVASFDTLKEARQWEARIIERWRKALRRDSETSIIDLETGRQRSLLFLDDFDKIDDILHAAYVEDMTAKQAAEAEQTASTEPREPVAPSTGWQDRLAKRAAQWGPDRAEP